MSLGVTKGNNLIFLSFSINIGTLLLQFNTAIFPAQTAAPGLWSCLQQCSLPNTHKCSKERTPNWPSPNSVQNLEMELHLSNNGLTYSTNSVFGTWSITPTMLQKLKSSVTLHLAKLTSVAKGKRCGKGKIYLHMLLFLRTLRSHLSVCGYNISKKCKVSLKTSEEKSQTLS